MLSHELDSIFPNQIRPTDVLRPAITHNPEIDVI
jgi:hypothetical protein